MRAAMLAPLLMAGACVAGPDWEIRRLDSASIPHDWGRGDNASIPVVELSGIEQIGRGWYVVVSGDLGEVAPARYGFLRIDLMADPGSGEPRFKGIGRVDQHFFLGEDGRPFPENTFDPASIRLLAEENLSRQYLVASEGHAQDGIGTSLFLYDQVEGAEELTLTPGKFEPGQNTGIRHNRGFGAQGVTPDGRYAYTASEEPLGQDEASGAVRILEVDLVTRRVTGEFAYVLGPATLGESPERLGLVELIAVERGRLLALERDADGEGGFDGRLYHVDVRQSDDVAGVDPMASAPAQPAVKIRLATLSQIGVPAANYEGMCLGAAFGEDGRLLVLVSDNDAHEGADTRFELLLIEGMREGENAEAIDDPDQPAPREAPDAEDPDGDR